MVFPVVMYGCESWTIKTECQRTDAFKLRCWRRLLKVPWTARRTNQSILREINPEYSLEGLTLKLKLQYFGYLRQQMTHWKSPWCWERMRAEREEGIRGLDDWTASPMQWTWTWATPGDGEGQGGLVRCSPQDHKELDMTGQLDTTRWRWNHVFFWKRCNRGNNGRKRSPRSTEWSQLSSWLYPPTEERSANYLHVMQKSRRGKTHLFIGTTSHLICHYFSLF